jgi:hypothetical protein
MKALPDTAEFYALAGRVLWFEPPEQALRNVTRFMAYAFRYATHEDMKLLRTVLSDDDLREALGNAPPGIIDGRSWSYWHAVLGVCPAPVMPIRGFGVVDRSLSKLNAVSP